MPLPTLGIYAPLPESRSGIADYAQYTATALAGTFDISFVSFRNYVPPAKFDHVLYHVGSGIDTAAAFQALGERPGPVILHEYVLSQFFIEHHVSLDSPTNQRVRQIFSAASGYEFANSADLDRLMRTERERELHYLDIGIERLIVERATDVFVHSRASFEVLRKRYGGIVQLLDFPAQPVPRDNRRLIRLSQGIPDSATVFGSFGHVGTNKHLDVIIDAWASLEVDPEFGHLLIVGAGTHDLQPHPATTVTVLDYIPCSSDFFDLLGICDVGLQLRWPTLGETSGVVCQLLASGIPVLVNTDSILPSWSTLDSCTLLSGEPPEPLELANVLRSLIQERPTIGDQGAAAIGCWLNAVTNALAVGRLSV